MRTAVLISGRGSNLQALIAATRATDHPAEIALVLSNRPDAGGLGHAAAAGITSQVVDQAAFAGPDRAGARATYDAALTEALEAAGIELVCLAGFMRVLTGTFVDHWRDRLINIHPSLLPAFPGLDTHERALAAGVKLHGCTVHYVRQEVDNGPIIGQAAVPVLAWTRRTAWRRGCLPSSTVSIRPACVWSPRAVPRSPTSGWRSHGPRTTMVRSFTPTPRPPLTQGRRQLGRRPLAGAGADR